MAPGQDRCQPSTQAGLPQYLCVFYLHTQHVVMDGCGTTQWISTHCTWLLPASQLQQQKLAMNMMGTGRQQGGMGLLLPARWPSCSASTFQPPVCHGTAHSQHSYRMHCIEACAIPLSRPPALAPLPTWSRCVANCTAASQSCNCLRVPAVPPAVPGAGAAESRGCV